MLRDEIKRYTELSGNDGEHTPIGIIGAYLDGYEKGLESRENKTGEWMKSEMENEKYVCSECGGACWYYDKQGIVARSRFCPNCGARMKGGE